MHIVLVYRCYNDGTACYNLTFLHEKSLMTDLGLPLRGVAVTIRAVDETERDNHAMRHCGT